MKVEILEFVEGARKARGITVIIDVFRAFSVGCYAYDSGAERIIATGDVEAAFNLRKIYSNALLVGERDEKMIPGFDLGNSPTEIMQADLHGKTVIHTTTAGTQGLINASLADVVITGSLVNSGAVVRFIQAMKPDHVSLVAMGYRATQSAEEDLLCAHFIKDGLLGENSASDEMITALMETSGKRFFNQDNIRFSPPSDFFLCTMKDRFNFILRAETREDGNIALIKTEVF
ncbi:MAG: 2-phosphosulfolactate phosphatase [Bacteroidales bacterium]|nr:2-phosphosulfolactate phosphatase [Bacteroidales bacterium]